MPSEFSQRAFLFLIHTKVAMWTTAGLYKVDHAFLSPVLQYCLENPSSFFMSLFECLLLHELAWMSHEFPISPQNYDFCLSHDLTIEQL